LKFLLPSGEAVLFVPTKMDDGDFEILNTYLKAHKRASGIEKTPNNETEDNDE